MKLARLLGPLLVSCLLVGSGQALASLDSSGPSNQPKTSGPLTFDGSQCSDQVVRSNSGTVLGDAEVCLFLYSFDNLSEIDLMRDYGAAWLQARFVPAAGWCATAVTTKVEIADGRLESISKNTMKGRKAAARMVITAGDRALEDGKISQTWKENADLAHAVAPDGTRPAIATEWDGKTATPVTLVGGLAYSYSALAGAPEKIDYGFSEFSLTTC